MRRIEMVVQHVTNQDNIMRPCVAIFQIMLGAESPVMFRLVDPDGNTRETKIEYRQELREILTHMLRHTETIYKSGTLMVEDCSAIKVSVVRAEDLSDIFTYVNGEDSVLPLFRSCNLVYQMVCDHDEGLVLYFTKEQFELLLDCLTELPKH